LLFASQILKTIRNICIDSRFWVRYEIFIVKPDASVILYDSFVPSLGGSQAILLVVEV
jgi:hypothetical protein